jgi:hypothetical protein
MKELPQGQRGGNEQICFCPACTNTKHCKLRKIIKEKLELQNQLNKIKEEMVE